MFTKKPEKQEVLYMTLSKRKERMLEMELFDPVTQQVGLVPANDWEAGRLWYYTTAREPFASPLYLPEIDPNKLYSY